MKGWFTCLLAAALLSSGCLPNWGQVREDDKLKTGPVRSAAPAPPVTADTVTPKNAHDKARELAAELEREAARGPN
jgi:hypothetical protein